MNSTVLVATYNDGMHVRTSNTQPRSRHQVQVYEDS